jgi:hypothetical protein
MIKNIWELFLFKCVIPKYLRRIWINKIRFEKRTSGILKRMWQSVSAVIEEQSRFIDRFTGEPE